MRADALMFAFYAIAEISRLGKAVLKFLNRRLANGFFIQETAVKVDPNGAAG
jgi:hypothetical protein